MQQRNDEWIGRMMGREDACLDLAASCHKSMSTMSQITLHKGCRPLMKCACMCRLDQMCHICSSAMGMKSPCQLQCIHLSGRHTTWSNQQNLINLHEFNTRIQTFGGRYNRCTPPIICPPCKHRHSHDFCRKRTCLSPVRTQILMPALARRSMASGTPDCSLSSMAVQPSSSSSRSIRSPTAASFSSRPVRAVLASKYFCCHLHA